MVATNIENNKIEALVISNYMGVVRVVMPNGQLCDFRLKGFSKMGADKLKNLIVSGKVSPDILKYTEIPDHINLTKESNRVSVARNFRVV